MPDEQRTDLNFSVTEFQKLALGKFFRNLVANGERGISKVDTRTTVGMDTRAKWEYKLAAAKDLLGQFEQQEN